MKQTISPIGLLIIAIFLLVGCVKENKLLLTEFGEPTLKLSTNFVDKDITQATVNIDITTPSNITWKATVQTGIDWFSIASDKQTGAGSFSLPIDFQENIDLAPREGNIFIIGYRGDSNEPIGVSKIKIIQAGRAPFIKLVNADGDEISELNVSRMGGNSGFRIVSNIDWKFSFSEISTPETPATWLSAVSPANSQGSKGASISINATGNPSYDNPRSAKLLVEGVNVTSPVQASLTVKQATRIDAQSIRIVGMSGILKDGQANITLEPQPSGSALIMPGEVNVDGSGTSILLYENVAVGNYVIKTVKYTDATSVDIGGFVNIIASSDHISPSEHWDNALKMFGGDSPARPITIANATQLKLIADAVNSGNTYEGIFLKQTSDISLAEFSNWIPIGSTTNRFKGIYDGNNKMITDLTITSTAANAGFIGFIEGTATLNAEVKNLSVYGTVTSSGAGSGCIVGRANNYSLISHCNNYATFAFTGGQSGGVVGTCASDLAVNVNRKDNILVEYCINKSTNGVVGAKNDNGGVVGLNYGTVRYCAHEGNIKSTIMRMGGVVGANYAVVERCYTSGVVALENVTTAYNSGGLLGFGSQYSILRDSYFCGDMSGLNENRAAALVGQYSNQNSGQTSIEIRNCYIVGVLSTNAGFIVGNNNGYGWNTSLTNGKITGIYHEEGASITKNSGNEAGSIAQYAGVSETLSPTNMKLKASFVGWDFDTIWTIDETSSYPYFKEFAPPIKPH
ncbi:MAG: hypothetical protein PHV20_05450 [Bacteroidales bacterium]|nr:hypothetical protein [Bacteroidales bacterium]